MGFHAGHLTCYHAVHQGPVPFEGRRRSESEFMRDFDWTRGARAANEAVVTSQGMRMTHGELRAAVHRAATTLAKETGAGPGRVVALGASDPLGQLLGTLAALSTGAAVLPLDVRATNQTDVLSRARPVGVVRGVDAEGALRIDAPPAEPRAVDPRAALLLFTSGSSGAPKGVVLSGSGLLANVEAIRTYLPVDERSRTAIVLPLCYSYALVGQALVTLHGGGTVLLLNDLPFAISQLEAMQREQASGLSSVPTSLKLLCQLARDLPVGDRPPLRYLASAGAPLTSPVVSAMRAAFPEARLYNQYGLTEACPRVTALSDLEPPFERGSVGRPLPGIEVEVRGEDGQGLPPGAEGVLVVRGPSVMLGYLDDPEATERALDPGGLLTGDWGYRDAEGYLYVTGRRDGVVKVAGERIGVEAVASVLRQAAGVHEVCVVPVPDELLGARLVAVIEGDAECLAEVRAIARQDLPAAKRPQRYVRVAELPRTPNGKLDLQAIRQEAERA